MDDVIRDTMNGRTLIAIGLLPLLAIAALGVYQLSGSESQAAPAAADILNPHPAAGPFTADERTPDDCASAADDRRACFEQAFGNVAFETSGKEALALMAERSAAQPEISANCHRIAHTIGAAALAREDGDAAAALADGDSTCWSGFYHGLLERALAPARSVDELTTLIRSLCDPQDKAWPAFTHYQCLHGLGHGLMLRTGNALDASLDLCTRLQDGWSRQSCDGGVFMESFSPSLDLKPPPFDATKPLEPCPSVAESHKLYCYLQVADNLVRATEYAWPSVAAGCDTEPSRQWRAICFQGYGRQASGNNYGRPAAVAKLCGVAGAQGEPECVYGAARDIASNAASGAPAAVFCRVVAQGLRARCFEGVGTILATLATDTGVVREQCRRLAGAHRASCVRGAGLPA